MTEVPERSERMITLSVGRNAFKDRAVLGARCIFVCALALPMILLPGCKKEAEPEPQVTVQAEHPEQGPIAEHINADATLSPLAQAAIAPRISAPVRKFYVQRGAHVKEGQLLATLENKDLAAAAQDNKGSYMAARLRLQRQPRRRYPKIHRRPNWISRRQKPISI